MKIHLKSLAIFLFTLLLGCEVPENVAPEVDEPLEMTSFIINADTTDVKVARGYSKDIWVEGEFTFTQNYFFDEENVFSHSKKWFRAEYAGQGVFNAKIFNKSMCGTGYRDGDCVTTTEVQGSGVWQIIDKIPDVPHLNWEFLKYYENQRFEIRMADVPSQIEILDKPAFLSTSRDNVIRIRKDSQEDSVLFSLVVLPKENLKNGVSVLNYHQIIYPFIAENDQIVIPGDKLMSPNESRPSTSDTVFLNIAAVKKVYKHVDGKIMSFTYQVYNLHPVSIE